MSTISTLEIPKAPDQTSPTLLVERVFVFNYLVEAGGLEPPSEEWPTKASTSVSRILILEPQTPAGRIPWLKSAKGVLVSWRTLLDEQASIVTPGSVPLAWNGRMRLPN